MTKERIPQLRMMIPDMSFWQLDWELPAGYEIVTYSEGLENDWITIVNESFDKEFTADDWQRVILDKEGYRPDRVFFIREKSICSGFGGIQGV